MISIFMMCSFSLFGSGALPPRSPHSDQTMVSASDQTIVVASDQTIVLASDHTIVLGDIEHAIELQKLCKAGVVSSPPIVTVPKARCANAMIALSALRLPVPFSKTDPSMSPAVA